MKHPLLIFISAIALIFSSCSDQRPQLNDIITSKKTPKHLNIGGTRLFIIPPKDFTIADDFVGLIKNRNCTIRIIESKGEKIRTVLSLYTDSIMIKQGKKILDSRQIRVNEYSGRLTVTTGEYEKSETAYLLFGDNSFSVLVTADYPTIEKKTREEIYQALKSIYFDRNFKSELPVYSPYFFSDEPARYQFCEKVNQFDMYTVSGDLKSLNTQEPVIMVTTLKHMKNVDLDKIAEMNSLSLKQQGATLTGISEISEDPINGYDAYSRKLSFILEGHSKTSYQAFIKKREQVVVIQGIVFDKDLDKLAEIKAFSSSIYIR